MCKRSREIVVLKSYTMSSICELYQHQIYREVRLHNSLQHENIITLYAAFQVRWGLEVVGVGEGGSSRSMWQ
jgi:serine/threonine protein kinase